MDLNDSSFFDSRILAIVRQHLREDGSRPTVRTGLNQTEIALSDFGNEIRELDKQLDGGLYELLNNCKTYVPVSSAVFFLHKAHLQDELIEAAMTIENAAAEGVYLKSSDFDRILEESKDTSMVWLMMLEGEQGKNRYDYSTEPKKSDLNLDRMKKFK